MSKFCSKITDTLQETGLKRVKVTYLGDYVGYILEEATDGRAIVFVVSGEDPEQVNQMISVAPDQYQEIPDETNLSVTPLQVMKQTAAQYLIDKGLINHTQHDRVDQLMDLPCVHAVEDFLRGYNITDTEIITILKSAIS